MIDFQEVARDLIESGEVDYSVVDGGHGWTECGSDRRCHVQLEAESCDSGTVDVDVVFEGGSVNDYIDFLEDIPKIWEGPVQFLHHNDKELQMRCEFKCLGIWSKSIRYEDDGDYEQVKLSVKYKYQF